MKLKEAFFSLSRARQIAVVVCIIHLAILSTLFGHHFFSRRSKPMGAIAVRTFIAEELKEGKKEAHPGERPPPTSRRAEPKQSKPKPNASNTADKPAKPKAPSIAAHQKKEPRPAAPKREPPLDRRGETTQDTLLGEIAQQLEAFSSAPPKRERASLQLPGRIAAKTQMEQASSPDESDYGQHLVAYLQTVLDLPEYGEVKAALEIDRFGKLIDCKILESKSTKNGQFLKMKLEQLDYPSLQHFGIVDSTQTFTIVFRNDR